MKDLGSLNGTYVNNRRIKEEQKLLPNHLLTLGNVTFRAVYEAPVSEAPVPDVASKAEQPVERNEDETINFEELLETPANEHDTVPDSKDEPAAAEASHEKPAADSAEHSESNESEEVPRSRKDVASEPAPSASSIFSGDEEFVTPEKSICISALQGLPSQVEQSSISFAGQLKDIAGSEQQVVDSIDLDLPDSGRSAQSDVDLGSFLKKIPR